MGRSPRTELRQWLARGWLGSGALLLSRGSEPNLGSAEACGKQNPVETGGPGLLQSHAAPSRRQQRLHH